MCVCGGGGGPELAATLRKAGCVCGGWVGGGAELAATLRKAGCVCVWGGWGVGVGLNLLQPLGVWGVCVCVWGGGGLNLLQPLGGGGVWGWGG